MKKANYARFLSAILTVALVLTFAPTIGVLAVDSTEIVANKTELIIESASELYSSEVFKFVVKSNFELGTPQIILYDKDGKNSGQYSTLDVSNEEFFYYSASIVPPLAGVYTVYCGYYDAAGKHNYTNAIGITVLEGTRPIPRYTLTYDSNGLVIAPVVHSTESSIKLTIASDLGYNPRGLIFIGWNTKQDGTGTHYLNDGPITLTADTTLYAQWAKLDARLDIWADNIATQEADKYADALAEALESDFDAYAMDYADRNACSYAQIYADRTGYSDTTDDYWVAYVSQYRNVFWGFYLEGYKEVLKLTYRSAWYYRYGWAYAETAYSYKGLVRVLSAAVAVD